MTPEERGKRAEALFREGYNCAQAVVLAFADILPYSEGELSKLSCSFGGGMGRLREVCGCVTGMFLVCGMLEGYEGAETGDVKAAQYSRIQELAKAFEKENGSIICRELLGLSEKRDDPVPSPRTEEYYKKRTCAEKAGCAARILAEHLLKNDTK